MAMESDLKILKTEVQSLDRHLSLVKKKLEILESTELSSSSRKDKNCSSCSSPLDHGISIQDHVILIQDHVIARENEAEDRASKIVDHVLSGKKGKKKANKEQQQQHKMPFCHSLLLEKENLRMLSLETPSPVLSIVDGIQEGHNANNLNTMDIDKNIDAHSNSSPPQLIAVKNGKSDNHLVSTAYCARLSSHLRRDSLIVAFLQGVVGFRQENGHLVVEKIAEDSPLVKRGLIHVGDSIMEVNGAPVATTDDLKSQLANQEVVTLKIVQSGLGAAPVINGDFVKCCFDYEPENDQLIPNKKAGLKFRTGDVLQILNKDDDSDWWQARKVNDWSFCGLIPSRTFEERRKASVTDQNNKEKKKATIGVMKKLLYNSKDSHDFDEHDQQIYRDVCKLSPYGRRVIVLIGASGVGRRTLKARLLQHDRDNFATVTPYTSRKARDGETEGREYHFESKDQLKKEIDQQKFLEYGEYNGNIYGTKLESVKSIVKNGKVCVLDCGVQAIKQLYNSDFMPYIVFVAPPPLEEFKQIYLIHPNRTKQKSNEDLERICEESTVLDQHHRHLFDLTLINRNVEVTFRRLYDALESLKNHSQWIPSKWLYG